ncbi:flagellar hook capping FlgD N-terminal domain-containing protein [Balneolaceae bacterium ANBcel3]|nr:flagellar hook capping FlgD N-terminal domain-containing protein [Balneolaceae bacterium ANBcel3]
MDIQSINSQTSAAFRSSDPNKRNEMGQQQFLQLLVAQMRHQDPINPLDGAEFASQLAQFNSVEQLINVNEGLGRLFESQKAMNAGLNNSMATSLAGKPVKALTSSIHLPPGESTSIQFKLNNTAAKVDVVIMNESGREVRRESLQNLVASDHQWTWDGRNDAGQRMADGNYYVAIEATSDDGSKVDALTYIEGIATKVRYTGDGVKLTVNGVDIPIGDVQEVGMAL